LRAAVIVLAGHAPARTWLLFTVAVPTLLLDAVDGAVARRTGTVTESGGLLDMQVDAGVLVVLSLAVAARFGPWVVLIGVMRYALVVASWIWPTLSTALPRSRFRVVVAGLQGAVLAAAIAPLLPIGVCRVALVVALALLIASFVSQIAAIRGAHTSPSPRRSQIDRGWASKWIRVGRSRRP
jgi:phosphatidylglycerophosphate synthase